MFEIVMFAVVVIVGFVGFAAGLHAGLSIADRHKRGMDRQDEP